MRVTVEIDEKKMDSIRKLTRQEKKSPALAMALDRYLEQERCQAFLRKVMEGKTDYHASNDEVEALARMDRP